MGVVVKDFVMTSENFNPLAEIVRLDQLAGCNIEFRWRSFNTSNLLDLRIGRTRFDPKTCDCRFKKGALQCSGAGKCTNTNQKQNGLTVIKRHVQVR